MFFTEFVEFSDKKIMTLRGLEPAIQPPLVLETSMLPQRQKDTCERLDLELSPCFSDLSVSLNLLNSAKVLLHLGKTPLNDICAAADYIL